MQEGRRPLSASLDCGQGLAPGIQPLVKWGFQTRLMTEIVPWSSEPLLGVGLLCSSGNRLETATTLPSHKDSSEEKGYDYLLINPVQIDI